MIFLYINMSTLQYKFITTSTLLFMGLKTRCKQSEFYLVESAQCKHETYAITYIVLWYSYGGHS